MLSRLFACFIVSDEEASTARVSDDERAEYFRFSQEIRGAEALQGFSSVSSQSLSVLVGNETFFSRATMLMQDLETKKARHAVLKNKLMLQGVGEEMLEDTGMQSLADSVANTLREKTMCAMSLIKRRQEMINKETGFSNQFPFFSKKLAFHSFSKIQVYFVVFLSPSGNVSVCV